MPRPLAAAALLALLVPLSTAAQSFCSSDGRPQPAALLERFIDADCADCWASRTAERPGRATLALDWVLPGQRGDDAPLAAVARPDARQRLQALGRQPSGPGFAVQGPRRGRAGSLRVAHGLPVNGYVGTSVTLRAAASGPWTAWLALVEVLPAGTEGSPVERRLVRNLLRLDWPAGRAHLHEARPMAIPEGANPDRLRVVGWVEDARGVIRAISESACGPGGGRG